MRVLRSQPTGSLRCAYLMISLLISLLISLYGCEGSVEVTEITPPDRISYSPAPHRVSLRFLLDEGAESLANQEVALGVTIREVESRLVVRHEWVDYLIERPAPSSQETMMPLDDIEREGNPGSINITALSALNPLELYTGTYELRFFFKRKELNLTSHAGSPQEVSCPRPFSLRAPLDAKEVDPGLGDWLGVIQRDQTLEVNLKRQTCGPGELTTQVRGSIQLPSALSDAAQSRLMLHLTPQSSDSADEVELRAASSISFPLAPHLTAHDEIGLFSFSLTQVPEGRFSLQVFVDSDGDSLPTPCDSDRRRGGDRWIAAHPASNQTFTRGAQTEMDEPWILETVAACDRLRLSTPLDDPSMMTPNDDQSAVFLGQLNLTPNVLSALAFSPSKRVWFSAQRRALPPRRFIEAQELFDLSDAIIAEGRFSVHLDQSATYDPQEFAVWIDDGYDKALTPCDDPANRGSDVWWWEGDSESLSALLTFDLSQPPPLTPLNISQRCEAPEAMVEVEFELNFTWPDSVSTRPLVLVYQNLTSGELSESVITDLDQEAALTFETSPQLTRLQLSPGSYILSAYIDQDLDDRFTPCSDRILGDRFSTGRGVSLNLSNNEIITKVLSLTPRECPSIASQLILSLTSDLTDRALEYAELSPAQPEDESDSCRPQEVKISIADVNPLNARAAGSPNHDLIGDYCISLDQLPYALDFLPAGYYQLSACTFMSTIAINQALDEARSSAAPSPWGDCLSPRYWSTSREVQLTLSEAQPIELRLTPQCTCD